jgi:hypothetical protein
MVVPDMACEAGQTLQTARRTWGSRRSPATASQQMGHLVMARVGGRPTAQIIRFLRTLAVFMVVADHRLD